ncbi:MAG: polysaccharide deacetylase family protein [Pseudomonadota bacterium]
MPEIAPVKLAVKVDVDTRLGALEGLPRLRRILGRRDLQASFFLSLGPDNSGRAVLRLFTRPGFFSKMLRTRALKAYGLRTLLYGTLLPAPLIGAGQAEVVRGLIKDGHEVGLHAWDHVKWHDHLWRMTADQVRGEVSRGINAFIETAGGPPRSFAAPAWRINGPAAAALVEAGLVYMSSTRGTEPCRPVIDGREYPILEIPTTLPTSDEVLGREGRRPGDLADYFFKKISRPGLHVFTIHAEMEGRGLAGVFEEILDLCLARQVVFVRLMDVAQQLLGRREQVPAKEIIRAKLPGRAGLVSCQAP